MELEHNAKPSNCLSELLLSPIFSLKFRLIHPTFWFYQHMTTCNPTNPRFPPDVDMAILADMYMDECSPIVRGTYNWVSLTIFLILIGVCYTNKQLSPNWDD